MTLGLAACGSSNSGSDNGGSASNDGGSSNGGGKETVKITMWGAEEDQTMLRAMADKFIEMHKDEATKIVNMISINLIYYSQI